MKLFKSMFLYLCVFFIYANTTFASYYNVFVIVNKDQQKSTMNIFEVKGYFTGTIKFFPDGTKVQIYVLPPEFEETSELIFQILGESNIMLLEEVFIESSISSRSNGFLITVESSEEMIDRIASEISGLGYAEVYKDNDRIKTVEIQ